MKGGEILLEGTLLLELVREQIKRDLREGKFTRFLIAGKLY
jgi:hypothetical protein